MSKADSKWKLDHLFDHLLKQVNRLLAYPNWLPIQRCQVSFYYGKLSSFYKEFQSFPIRNENCEYELFDNIALSNLVSQILESKQGKSFDPPDLTLVGDRLALELAGITKSFMQDPRDFASLFYFDKGEFQDYEGEVFVGLQTESSNLLQQLVSITKERLQVISIVGMGGVGKTTLAARLYNDPCVVSSFHLRAFVTFSQFYHKRDILLRILRSVADVTDEVCKKNNEMLANVLYSALVGRRYLIVVDGIWTSEAWDDFKTSFPDDSNGSKIMLTTRLKDVALHAQSEGSPLHLHFLQEEDSFDLFRRKAFINGHLHNDLSLIGRSIIRKCDGIPLAIAVIAGVLKYNFQINWWVQVADTVNYTKSFGFTFRALELCYKHLPQHLKPCFLSFGAFPEDHDIPVCELILFWIAQGFISQGVTEKSLEDVAEEYFMDLIGRSLVVANKKGSNGAIETCFIHDLLRDLCLKKAEEENFSPTLTNPSTSQLFLGTNFETKEFQEHEKEVFVGFQVEANTLLQRLACFTKKHLEVIPIVGMAGLGKTTLARRLYYDPYVVSYFYVRAWVTCSQIYHKRDILLGILRSIAEITDEVSNMNDTKLAHALYCALKGRRYLIVIDDIWSNEAWDDFKRSFPNDNNGSRILLTTRLKDVALHAQPEGNPLCLRFLTKKESYDLFRRKAFEDEYIFGDLSWIGRRITQKCRGLPLAIVVIAGLLKTNMDKDWWMQVAESVSSYIVTDENQYMDTLSLSYNHLPQHLRPCFLSFGAFPEDHDIPVRKLLWLWIAEGFIHQDSTKRTLEDVAENYLMDLIRRSLVVVGKIGSTGVIKTCRIHDLLRDLCLRKFEDDISSSNIYEYNKHSYSCSHSLTDSSTKSRLLLSTNVTTIPLDCCCYISEVSKSFFKDVSIVWETSKLITALDISSIELYIFPTELLQLVHLKYLELRFRTGDPPESVSHLQELQTLIISSRMNMVVPNSVWKMTNLRHLCIKTGENLVNFSNVEEEPSILENLQTMSLVSPTRPCQHIIARSRNLKRLGLCGPLTTKDGDLICPDLGHLMHLETLKLLNTIPLCKAGSLSTSIIFPGTLKNLTMSNTYLDWKEAWVFEMIPNLEVLKLKFHAFVGKDWEPSPEAFRRLKSLKLDDLDIEIWTASRNHFPVLQRLRVYRCPYLVEIPEDFGNICTLEWIELRGCNEAAANSARDIQQEQESYGNDCLKILLIPGLTPS